MFFRKVGFHKSHTAYHPRRRHSSTTRQFAISQSVRTVSSGLLCSSDTLHTDKSVSLQFLYVRKFEPSERRSHGDPLSWGPIFWGSTTRERLQATVYDHRGPDLPVLQSNQCSCNIIVISSNSKSSVRLRFTQFVPYRFIRL
jgi:hypothetical protein